MYDFIHLEEARDILFFLLVIAVSVQFFFFIYFFTRLIGYKKKTTPPTGSVTGLSIVILDTKNQDGDTILDHLKQISRQEQNAQTDIEIILPRRLDWDNRVLNLEPLIQQSPLPVKPVNIHGQAQYIVGHKYAVSIGIKSARHEHILHTNTQCVPMSARWAQCFADAFRRGKSVILGYTKIEPQPGFNNKFIRFEQAQNALLMLSLAISGIPISGNGSNLAYTRPVFYKNKGFTNFNEIVGGEDTIFINQVATDNNTEVLLHPDSFMLNKYAIPYKEWLHQKTIQMSALKYYKASHLFLLTLYALSQMLFWGAFITYLLSPYLNYMPIIYTIGARYLGYFLIYGLAFRKLKEADLIRWLPLMDLLIVFHQIRMLPKFFSKYRYQ